MFYEVIPTKIYRNGSSALTYASDLKLEPGHIVTIPLGKTSCVGIVLKKVPKPSFPCKPIIKLLYSTPLPSHLLKSALWLSSYYLAELPVVANLLLPIGIEKHRKKANSCSVLVRICRPQQSETQQSPSEFEVTSSTSAGLIVVFLTTAGRSPGQKPNVKSPSTTLNKEPFKN